MGKAYVVFDLDGTLINVESCAQLAHAGEWDSFHEATFDCPPYQWMVDYVLQIQQMKTVDWIVVTSKPEKYHARTMNWLTVRGLMPDAVLMRPTHDFSSSTELKFKLLAEHFGENWKQQVLFAVEDRDKMVDAWRAAGVPCMQCAPSLY